MNRKSARFEVPRARRSAAGEQRRKPFGWAFGNQNLLGDEQDSPSPFLACGVCEGWRPLHEWG